MTEGIIIALIIGIPAIITSVVNTIVTLKNAYRIEDIKKHTNSMKDALVAAALLEGEHVGKEKQIKKQKSENNGAGGN